MAGLFGQVGEFDSNKENWAQDAEHTGHIFKANGISDEEKVTALFLMSIG